MRNYMSFNQAQINAFRPLWDMEPESVGFSQNGANLADMTMRAYYPAILRDDVEVVAWCDGPNIHYVMSCHNGDEVLSVTFDKHQKGTPTLELALREGAGGEMVPHRVNSLAEFLLEFTDSFSRSNWLGEFERSMLEMFARSLADAAHSA